MWSFSAVRVHVDVLPAVDVHRDLHIDTFYTSAAIALLARFLPVMCQASKHCVAVMVPCWHTSVT
jgi:hypothetical protein